jgi:hypothetical protein
LDCFKSWWRMLPFQNQCSMFHVKKKYYQIIYSIHQSRDAQDWLATKLLRRINVVTGNPYAGCSATISYKPVLGSGEVVKPDLWLWHHPVKDGDGKTACHYSLISQARFFF